jgi:hypothetical protein
MYTSLTTSLSLDSLHASQELLLVTKLPCLIAQDIQIVMESIPDLLYLKRHTWPRQIPPTKMRLAKGQVQEHAISLS